MPGFVTTSRAEASVYRIVTSERLMGRSAQRSSPCLSIAVGRGKCTLILCAIQRGGASNGLPVLTDSVARVDLVGLKAHIPVMRSTLPRAFHIGSAWEDSNVLS
jgi:hypothetical protein